MSPGSDKTFQSTAPVYGGPGHYDPVRRRLLALVGLGYVLFVVYGSLVPFDFQPKPLDAAWQEFLSTRYFALGIASRADWIANLLLYIPLGFCFTAAFSGTAGHTGGGNLMSGITVCIFGAIVAAGIEFAQLFFPPRTVSLNDIIAELIGTTIGIALWSAAGTRFAYLTGTVRLGGRAALQAAATVYVLAYFALSFFPYDFVLNSSELKWKLETGLYGFIIAPGSCDGVLVCSVKLAVAVAAAIPIGLLLEMVLAPKTSGPYARTFAMGCVLGTVIEGGQFFLASGVSQGISILTCGTGVMLGVAVQRAASPERLDATRGYWRPAVVLATAPYVGLLMALNGWFSARWTDAGTALMNLGQISFLPFYYHYFTTESYALRSLLSQAAAYAPVGIGYWMWRTGGGVIHPGNPWVPAVVAAALAFVMEAGKLFVPERRPDPTDLLIAGCSAYLACAIATAVQRWAAQGAGVAPAHTQPAPQQSAAQIPEAPGLVARALSLPLLIAVSGFAWLYPYSGALSVFLGAYAVVLWLWPRAALPAVLALLPLLDLSPWTGWFFFDEFDAVLLVTVVVMLWRMPSGNWSLRGAGLPTWLILALLASYATSTVIGLLPPTTLDLNAYANYHSHYNSLRTLKGFVWALILTGPAIHLLREGVSGERALAGGMLVGIAGVVLAALWERSLFTGLFDFSTNFRITSTFSAMHIGGSYIEAYLVLAIPFLAAWARVQRGATAHGATIVVFGLASYVVMVTFSRMGYVGYAAALAILVTGILVHAPLSGSRPRRVVLVIATLLAAACVIAIPELGGTFMQSRWATVENDAQVRYRHWNTAIYVMDDGLPGFLFGMGLGRFPETYFYRNPKGKAPPTYRYVREGNNVYLALGSGTSLYFEQRVTVAPETEYALEFDVRSGSANSELKCILCEKSILHSQGCRTFSVRTGAEKQWRHHVITLESDELGSGPWYFRRPVVLALFNPNAGTLVEVDNVKLLGPDGRDLMRNGDFSQGRNYWFFSSDDHLPWRTHNLAVQIYFEQGALGLLAFALALGCGCTQLVRGVVRGQAWASVILAALVGFVLVGVADSLFDAPRLTLLFYLLLFVAIAAPWRNEGRTYSAMVAVPRQ